MSNYLELNKLTHLGIRECKRIMKASDNNLDLAIEFINSYTNNKYIILVDILEISNINYDFKEIIL